MHNFSNFETKFFKLFATVCFSSIDYIFFNLSLPFQSVIEIDFFFSFLGLIKYRFILYFFEYRFPTLPHPQNVVH